MSPLFLHRMRSSKVKERKDFDMTENTSRRRPLMWWEQRKLENNGCYSADWSLVRICDDTDLDNIRNVEFVGAVSLGLVDGSEGASIQNARLENCMIGDNATIRNIGSHLRNCIVGPGARIVDTGVVEFEAEAMCGIGTEVSVLDETGSRAVRIYPGMSAQAALLMARAPKWNERHMLPRLEQKFDNEIPRHIIGANSVVEGCGALINVCVAPEVKVVGARHLRNGMIINNAAPGRCLASVGSGVDAENFIIEDGVADSGVILRNCYVGQGAMLEKGFTAHDSLFFANCSLENGEACALFAGPYTVSMHKSSLLIGCQTSFMNAGSGTNQSNHMYKLGPVHWGILERGVKTSSDSYLMLGAKIGAFSLLMGQHKTHPDSSQFPFSYLFGDEKGATVVVPGVMLRSCGLLRDEKKWPTRDRRLKRKLPMRDRIIFNVLSPLTVENMLTAIDVIDMLLTRPADDDRYLRYRGMKFTRASLERARHMYQLAIYKYLSMRLGDGPFPEAAGQEATQWVDIAGLPMPRPLMQKAMETSSLEEMEEIFDKAYNDYARLEMEWIGTRFGESWRRPAEVIADYAAEFDRMIEEDRTRYLEDLNAQNEMLAL